MTTQEARAATSNATIASFKYTPSDVQIAVGDTVVWRNLDATVHTVTASRGEFNSGSMRQGQEWSATFTVPGVYPYFCEPHEFMRGMVSVTGTAPTTTTATTAPLSSTTTAVAATAAPPASTTTTELRGSPPAQPGQSPSEGGTGGAVVAGAVTGEAEQPSPALAIVGVVAIAAALAGLLRRHLHHLAAGLTLATGLVHLQVRFALDYPEPIGTLLVIETAGAVLLTAWLVVHPWNRMKQLVAIGAHVAALVALAITRTGFGLFGFHEVGWDPSPQLPLAVTIGVLAIATLVAARPRFE